MKKLATLIAFLCAFAAAQAVTTKVSETSNYLEFTFSINDRLLTPGGTSESYIMSIFPGTAVNFFFQDRVLFLFGNIEQLDTNPSSGTYSFIQDTGALDFSGSYMYGSTLVNWSVESVVTTALRGDNWSGKFTAHAASVPEDGTTLVLVGLALLGILAFRSKFS